MNNIDFSDAFHYTKEFFEKRKSQIEPHLDKIGALANDIFKEFNRAWQIGKRNASDLTLHTLNWENKQFKDYFNYSWKSPVTTGFLGAKQDKMDQRYHGSDFYSSVLRNFVYADWMEKNVSDLSEKEKREIATIAAHRQIFYETTHSILWGAHHLKISGQADQEIAELQNRCDALSQTDSPQVVHIQNEQAAYSSFSFPGGYEEHVVSFECQHDANGQYFFVIHNRGEAVDDPEIHGRAMITRPEQIYAKTSVKIAVSLQQLKNPEFLGDLMKAMNQPTMAPCYAAIKKHLLQGNGSNIIVSQEEIAYLAKWTSYQELLQKIEKSEPANFALQEAAKAILTELEALADRLIQQDPAYHTVQILGTCSESSLTGPEKAMASAQTRRKIKLFTIDQLANHVARSRIIRPRHFRDRKILLAHHKFRRQQLTEKIAQNKPRP